MRVFLCLIALLSLNTFAAELYGELTINNAPKWKGVDIAGAVAPVHWEIAMHQPPAKKIEFVSIEPLQSQMTMTLQAQPETQTVINKVELNITLKGMQFQAYENCTASDASVQVQGKVLTFTQASIGQSVVCPSVQTPFSHFRPILAFPSINDDFNNADLPSGIYTGRIIATAAYDYINSSNLSVRHHIRFPIFIEIDFTNNQIMTLSANGEEEMKTEYYGYPVRMLSAQTSYKIESSTTIANELYMSLEPSKSKNNLFYLSRDDDPDNHIPYEVNCLECRVIKTLIDADGNARLNPNEKIQVPNNFTIQVSFKDKELEPLKHGYYHGQFRLRFSPQM